MHLARRGAARSTFAFFCARILASILMRADAMTRELQQLARSGTNEITRFDFGELARKLPA
ncbi:MAG: hypothetical protein HY898_27365 [Deltaproteobacteria bacterium]|nr:hypothetical protein [Deltaproteobacteria bacterium]